MNYIERIFQLRDEYHLTNKEVEIRAGLANSSMSQWKKGKGKPGMDSIIKIANFFDVSSDYILGLSDIRHPNSAAEKDSQLSEEERILLTAFQSASAINRFRIIQLCMNAMDDSSSGAESSSSKKRTF